MFIKTLEVENFKGYHGKHTIDFNIPDMNNDGSGLNIFVGENNSGKSTIFEALDFIKDSTKKEPNSLVNKSNPTLNLTSFSVEVSYTGNVTGCVNAHIQANKVRSFTNFIHLKGNNEHFKVKRSWDANTPDEIKKINFWDNANSVYTNTSGIDAPFKKFYDNNFIWADTNPSDESKFGASTICGSLLKEIALGHINTPEYQTFQQSYHGLFNNPSSQLRTKIAQIENMIQAVFSSQFGTANISFSFEELQIENFFKTASIIIDDGVSVPMSEKGHGMQRAVALSLLQVYANLTSNVPNIPISKPFYLFIDEPEICLHPSGQKKLLDALMVISKTKQVFVTTHSPFILSSPLLRNAGLFIFKKSNNRNTISTAKTSPMFPWSPSWGEISYRAYNLPTVDLHNELYGYLQEKYSLSNITSVDQWLLAKGLAHSKQWTQEKNGIPQQPKNTTLQSFIRNHIHHPENITMQSNKYTLSELEQSIDEMLNLI
ncbi:ATP-dependent nuclease [Enterobacter bugandensis]|uniref:ATP-dependent nuclease n=1 Tax=Enterobacter bugandensis TaxID=881260 RepID=UPI0020063C9A|nr:AAA family ATPase [Enterobacter bugandensis]MCK7311173.1 ATP-binding protein [Enterobacter bugandensis]MCU6168914.1 ATP-binding protein [Enterobacter bugandensis]MDH0085893.1 ATP-binding protein [Enterobacter bugandensis]MDH0109407.1 ATP-binding protein [Enterobacter bugandensis]MDH0127715.1 ATP-binding protein [Enterobacter bugandensis]